MSVEKTCGNCKSIRYSGIQKVKMQFGGCDKYKLSDRFAVRTTDEPCPHWKPRSKSKMTSEKSQSESTINRMKGVR